MTKLFTSGGSLLPAFSCQRHSPGVYALGQAILKG
jgi:hypothetical protein